MKLLVALGGNALLQRSESPTAAHQLARVQRACSQLARVAADNGLVLTHGNGPQVGQLALQAAAGPAALAFPLDVLDAETAGMLGYLLEQELANRLPPTRSVVTLLTRVEVDPADPAFQHPTKPIGPSYAAADAAPLAAQHGWTMAVDGDGLRRVVAAPRPLRVPALDAMRWLLEHNTLLIVGGGGGIPVVRRADGQGLQGVEAVIDKDLCSALIAEKLDVDCLLIATDVDGVMQDWGLPTQRLIGATTPRQLQAQRYAAGSMQPKVEAACSFVKATGRRAAIGSLERIEDLLAGTAGTQVTADD